MTITFAKGRARPRRILASGLVSALALASAATSGSAAASELASSLQSFGTFAAASVQTELAASATPTVLTKASWGGKRSGLTWASGASSGGSALEALRGRALDVGTTYTNRKGSWADMVTSASNVKVVAKSGVPVIGIGLFPDAYRGQHAQCAAGAFDTYMRQVGVKLVQGGGAQAAIRLGWEFNFVNKFSWAVTGTDEASATKWKNCFRRWVQNLRATPGQAFTIVWNAATNGSHPNVDMLYPGTEYVDVVATQYYDRCPPATDETLWQARYNKRAKSGAPAGLGTWLAYAKSKAKRLAIPEWGIGGPINACKKPGIDNPFFIRKMNEFLKANAASIAFEAYFNGNGTPGVPGSHKLSPATYNPKSSALYQQLW
jgi:hypothetical protein